MVDFHPGDIYHTCHAIGLERAQGRRPWPAPAGLRRYIRLAGREQKPSATRSRALARPLARDIVSRRLVPRRGMLGHDVFEPNLPALVELGDMA